MEAQMSDKTSGVSAETIANFFQEEGYQAKIRKVEARAWIESAADGQKIRLYLYDPIELENELIYRNFMFDTGYSISRATRIDLLTAYCNLFNSEYRFLKTFVVKVEEGGYVALQMDETSGWGIEGIKFAFAFFLKGIRLFREKIIETSAYYGDNAVEKHNEALDCLKDDSNRPERGVELYREASKEGFAGSQNNLGDLYETGMWVPESPVIAAYWYARAAERGEPTAYLSLAGLLSDHAKDDSMLIEAMTFAILAFNKLPEGVNQRLALEALKNLEDKLSEEQISEAKAQAENWNPLYQERRLMNEPDDKEEQKATELRLLN
jgi:hypothetical protein